MSTRGSFVIIKNGISKKLGIRHDAYPNGAGMDIAELIKTVDISDLFERIDDYDAAMLDVESFDKEDFPDEPDPFELSKCRIALKRNGILYGRVIASEAELDSIFNEYVYIADLDRGELTVSVCECFIRNEDNTGADYPKATEDKLTGMSDGSPFQYALKTKVVFELEYIHRCKVRDITGLMDEACKDKSGGVARYSVSDITPDMEILDDYSKDVEKLADYMQRLMTRLKDQGQRSVTISRKAKGGLTKYGNV